MCYDHFSSYERILGKLGRYSMNVKSKNKLCIVKLKINPCFMKKIFQL